MLIKRQISLNKALNFRQCLIFKQRTVGVVLALTCLFPCFAKDQKKLDLEELNPLYKESRQRGPSNYVPNDQIEPVPHQTSMWLAEVFVEDDSGVLRSIQTQFNQWQDTEQYVKNWDLESTGIYHLPTTANKNSYFNKEMLRYVDKRLSGEIKHAEAGSALHRVGQVQEVLRPKAEAQLTSYMKLKFKARVLQGKGLVALENPYANVNAEVNREGKIYAHTEKEVKTLGLKASVDYYVSDDYWVTRLDRPLNDNVNARLSSVQTDSVMAFSGNADKILELLYHYSF